MTSSVKVLLPLLPTDDDDNSREACRAKNPEQSAEATMSKYKGKQRKAMTIIDCFGYIEI